MPQKKTSQKKKRSKSKLTAAKKKAPIKKALKKKSAKKKATKKKAVRKKAAAVKTKAPRKRKVSAKKKTTTPKPARKESRSVKTEPFAPEGLRTRSGRQAGDLQGLSFVEGADSESVNDLLEEGNTFEADVVAGVEAADNSDEKEVRTHEVPEDDVPGEYLDEE
jgi:hypothetical protein